MSISISLLKDRYKDLFSHKTAALFFTIPLASSFTEFSIGNFISVSPENRFFLETDAQYTKIKSIFNIYTYSAFDSGELIHRFLREIGKRNGNLGVKSFFKDIVDSIKLSTSIPALAKDIRYLHSFSNRLSLLLQTWFLLRESNDEDTEEIFRILHDYIRGCARGQDTQTTIEECFDLIFTKTISMPLFHVILAHALHTNALYNFLQLFGFVQDQVTHDAALHTGLRSSVALLLQAWQYKTAQYLRDSDNPRSYAKVNRLALRTYECLESICLFYLQHHDNSHQY